MNGIEWNDSLSWIYKFYLWRYHLYWNFDLISEFYRKNFAGLDDQHGNNQTRDHEISTDPGPIARSDSIFLNLEQYI